MQGNEQIKRQGGLRFVVALAAAHTAAAFLTIFVLAQIAPLIAGALPPRAAWIAVAMAALIGIAVDTRAAKRRRWSLGVARQTPKQLMFLGENAWIAACVWGFDTGLIWTTYRVSFCSWLLMLLATFGIAPAWSGLMYGAGFAIPLILATRFHPFHGPLPKPMPALPLQVSGVASMLVLVLALGSSLVLDHA